MLLTYLTSPSLSPIFCLIVATIRFFHCVLLNKPDVLLLRPLNLYYIHEASLTLPRHPIQAVLQSLIIVPGLYVSCHLSRVRLPKSWTLHLVESNSVLFTKARVTLSKEVTIYVDVKPASITHHQSEIPSYFFSQGHPQCYLKSEGTLPGQVTHRAPHIF